MCSYLYFPVEIDDSNFVFCCEGCRGHLLAQGSSPGEWCCWSSTSPGAVFLLQGEGRKVQLPWEL